MRINTIFIFFIFLIVELTSCKKEIVTADSNIDKGVVLGRVGNSSSNKQKINDWLDTKSRESQTKANIIASLRATWDTNNMRVENFDSLYDYVIIPVSSEFQSTSYPNAITNLLTILDSSENIVSMRLAYYVPDEDYTELPDNTFPELFKNNSVQDGKYAFCNLADIFLFETTIKDGVEAHRESKWNPGSIEDPCVTLWLVHTDVYYDHIEVTVDLLGTFCDVDNTDGGGGAGGTAPSEEPESRKIAHVNGWMFTRIPEEFGAGGLVQDLTFEGRFYNNNPQKNKFTGEAYGTNLYSIFNSQGGNGQLAYSNTKNLFTYNATKTTATCTATGTVQFPDTRTYNYSGTGSWSFIGLVWN